jgi:hypothetical protein
MREHHSISRGRPLHVSYWLWLERKLPIPLYQNAKCDLRTAIPTPDTMGSDEVSVPLVDVRADP